MLGQRSVRSARLHRLTEPQRCPLSSASRQPQCGGVRNALQAPQAARPTRDSPSSLQRFEVTSSGESAEHLRDGPISPPDRFLQHVSSSWAAFPSRSKLAVASHLAFAISNMVRSNSHSPRRSLTIWVQGLLRYLLHRYTMIGSPSGPCTLSCRAACDKH